MVAPLADDALELGLGDGCYLPRVSGQFVINSGIRQGWYSYWHFQLGRANNPRPNQLPAGSRVQPHRIRLRLNQLAKAPLGAYPNLGRVNLKLAAWLGCCLGVAPKLRPLVAAGRFRLRNAQPGTVGRCQAQRAQYAAKMTHAGR